MKKLTFALITIYFIFSSSLLANSASDYKEFKKNISSGEYDKAMDIYITKLDGLETNQYQGHIFKNIINLMKKDLDSAKILLKSFLDIQYNNDFAMYLLSQIELSQENYTKSIEILFNLNNKYLSDKFLDKVSKSYKNSIDIYHNVLLEINDFDKINELLYTFASYNDNKNLDDTYKVFFTIYENHIKDKSFVKALESLYIANKEFIQEDLELKFVNTIDKTIQQYIKNSYKNEKIQDLEALLDLVTKYNDSNNIPKVQKYLNRLKEKDTLSNIYKKEITLEKVGSHYYINAAINGQEVKLLLDTGATTTAINQSIIQSIEYTNIKDNIKINTANGSTNASLVSIDEFSIDDIVLNNFEIITLQKESTKHDGLLGMNFLKKFDFHIDQKNNILQLN